MMLLLLSGCDVMIAHSFHSVQIPVQQQHASLSSRRMHEHMLLLGASFERTVSSE
jgi:hypothetical protein